MECNRDEAIKAKTIAERKLTEKDFAGAKKFASKALSLYPGLDGVSQLMTALDVYISAENKVSGEVDWYGILGVNPSADDETMKKQYRKLALTLHPDKNKSISAEGAFKLVSEAWSLLSDKTKRLQYNQRRSSNGLFQQKVPSKTTAGVNGYNYFNKPGTSNVKTQNTSARMGPTAVPPKPIQRTDTFWTICYRCKMHYEYLKIYLNKTLLCPNCKQAFLASEVAPPSSLPKSSNLSSLPRHQNSNHRVNNMNQHDPLRSAQNSVPGGSSGVNQSGPTHVHQGPFARTGGASSMFLSPSASAKVANLANLVHLADERVKRKREETQSSALQGENILKKSRVAEVDRNGYGGNANRMATGHGRAGYVFSGFINKPKSTRDLTLLELRNMLMEKARREIRKKIKEWSSKNIAKWEKKKVKEREKEKVGSLKVDLKDINGYSAAKEKEGVERMSIDVPDPDFHDFDLDRTENCFSENQVWASYDDDDGMPRFYAMIHKVISLKPFKIRISWLNSKTTSEFGPLDWRGSGFSKTCGEFRAGKQEISGSLNSFSHEVKWTKLTRGTVCIYPQKGDIWALYRNWSPNWNEHTPDEVIHKYDMVEVLDDYNEDQGVSVTPLIKVDGFRTVFRQNLDPVKIMRIPREEMFRFSHRVPNYLLTGQEAPNAPKGCQELDPAAAPLELLQLKTEANEVTMVENGKEVEGEILSCTLKFNKDEIADKDTEGNKEDVENDREPKEGETELYKEGETEL